MALKASRIRSLFTYDPESGHLYRIRFHGQFIPSATAINDLTVTIDGREYRVDRVVWCYVNGQWPSGRIEHENGDEQDNRIDNLIEHANSPVAGKLLGAHFNRKTGKWYAMISKGGKNRSLGTYATAMEAHQVYLKARDGLVPVPA